MKPSISVSLIICGTLLLLFPFIYYLTYSSQQAYVLANRTDTRPAPGMLNYNPQPLKSPVQTGVGFFGLIMTLAWAVGGTVPWPKPKGLREAVVPVDINVTTYDPDET